jgi:cytochrome oxidase Cu insertion factor (SCO1/SenC/PrrC family)
MPNIRTKSAVEAMFKKTGKVKRARCGLSAWRQLFAGVLVAAVTLGTGIAFAAEKKDAVVYPALPFVSDYGGAFTLTDQNGQIFTDKDLLGHFSILYFGYTSCADICPMALHTIGTALTDMGVKGKGITPLFVNLDTNNNSAGDLKLYVDYFHPRFVGLTGTVRQIRAAASAYRIRYRPFKDKDGTPLIVHSGKIFFLGPEGKVLAYFPHEAPVEWLVQAMSQYMQAGKEARSSVGAIR